MQPIYVTKSLAALSSNGVAVLSSAGVTSTTVLNTSAFDTPRRLQVWGSSAVYNIITLTGTSEGGGIITETVIGSSIGGGAAVTTTQDFASLISVTLGTTNTGVASTTWYIGTSSRGGTPWKVIDNTRNPINLSVVLTPSGTAAAALCSFEYTNDYPTYSTVTDTWGGVSPLTGPVPVVSSLGTSVAVLTAFQFPSPAQAWRITITASSPTAGGFGATVLQSG